MKYPQSSDSASFDAVVTPRTSQLEISDAHIDRLSPDLFGTVAAMFDGNIRGEIQLLRVMSFDCPLQNLDELSAQFQVGNMHVMGAPVGDHQIVAKNHGADVEVTIDGESVDGTVSIADGTYVAEGRLLASGQLEAIARSLMRPLGASRYAWEVKGSIPC